MVAMAMSKSLMEEEEDLERDLIAAPQHNDAPSKRKQKAESSQEIRQKLVETLYPYRDSDSISSTPQFNQSELSKKYSKMTSPLHKKQVPILWNTSTHKRPSVSKVKMERNVSANLQKLDLSIVKTEPVSRELACEKPTAVKLKSEGKQETGARTETLQKEILEHIPSKQVNTTEDKMLDTFMTESKTILAEYQAVCSQKHKELRQKIDQLKSNYYSEVILFISCSKSTKIGKLTIEKEKKLQALQRKYEISSSNTFFLGTVALEPAGDDEATCALLPAIGSEDEESPEKLKKAVSTDLSSFNLAPSPPRARSNMHFEDSVTEDVMEENLAGIEETDEFLSESLVDMLEAKALSEIQNRERQKDTKSEMH
jgi:hypothetical protein